MPASLLSRQAADRPHQPALIAGGETLTWLDLSERVDALAAGLSARGVQVADRVGLLLGNCPEYVIGFLAAVRLGAAVVPLSAELKGDEAAALLQAAECRAVLAEDRFAPTLRAMVADGGLARAFVRGEGAGLPTIARAAAEPAVPTVPQPGPDADALVQFTSGTTGRPKRIVKSRAHLLNLAAAFAATVETSPADRILAVVPLSHGHGICSGILAFLQAGATLLVHERFDRRGTLTALARERITMFPAVPFICSVLADTRTAEPLDLSALRLCHTGGAPLRRDTWCKVRDRLGIHIRQIYGSTETGAITVNLDPDAEATADSVGRPLQGVEVAVLGPAGAPLPAGVEGEIAVRSPAAAQWSLTDRGREPLAGPDGWMRTGDLGRLDDTGRLYLTGRTALIINVAGRKVNPEEVEGVLAAHPKVREAAVVGVRDPYGEEAVKAVVVAAAPCTAEELTAHCRARLADYKAPRIVEFRGSLPRGPGGKLLRRALMDEQP